MFCLVLAQAQTMFEIPTSDNIISNKTIHSMRKIEVYHNGLK